MAQATSQIHVAHLLTSVEVGGAEHLVLQLAQHLPQPRFRASVICLRRGGALRPLFEEAGLEVRVLPDGEQASVAGLTRRLAAEFRREKPTILHTHNSSPALIGGVGRWIAGVGGHVHTKHGVGGAPSLLARAALRWVTTRADAIVAVSDQTRQEAIRGDGMPSHRVTVIRNGIDCARFHASAAHGEVSALRAIVVGRLEPIKGHIHLIDALPRIMASVPGFRLTVVGDGSERGRLEARAAELGVGAAVEFTGVRHDVAQMLSDPAIFVLPSLSEGVSLTLLEAMAAGLPIVATSVGGTPEVVDHEISALLVPSGDPEALAKGILRLMESPGLAKALVSAAHARVTAEFAIARMTASYVDLYESIVDQTNR